MGAPIPNQFAGNPYSAISAALSALRGPISHLRYLSAPLANALVRTFTRRRSIANTMASDILIVDDEADIRELVAGILQDEGHGTRTARDSGEALAAVVARRPNLVFLDIWLKGSQLDGLQLLDSLKQKHPLLQSSSALRLIAGAFGFRSPHARPLPRRGRDQSIPAL